MKLSDALIFPVRGPLPGPLRLTLVVASLAVSAGLTACGGDAAGEAEAIRALSESWLADARDRDAASIAARYADDGVVLSPGRPPVAGPEAIQADLEADWAANPDFTVEWTPGQVRVAGSGDMAWERGTWIFDPDGMGSASASRGVYVTVWTKVGGAWKIAADIGLSTDPVSQ